MYIYIYILTGHNDCNEISNVQHSLVSRLVVQITTHL